MMLSKKRTKTKFRLNKKRKISIVFSLICISILGVVLGVFVYSTGNQKGVLWPVPQGKAFNVLPRTSDQKVEEVEAFLQKEHILYTAVSVASDSAIVVSVQDNGNVYLSGHNYTEELASLQLIVSRLTMEGKRFRRLDLRFERPVIEML